MEAKVNNSEEQRKIRKSQSTLVVVGTGIMMFGAWAALRMYGLVLLRESKTVEEIRSMMPEGSDPVSDRMIIGLLLLFVTIYVLFELGVRVFVGLSAIAEGRGRRSGKVYIVFTFILILSALSAVLMDIIGIIGMLAGEDTGLESTTQTDGMASLIIDLTSLVMMIQMLASAFRVKRYKKQLKRTEAADAA